MLAAESTENTEAYNFAGAAVQIKTEKQAFGSVFSVNSVANNFRINPPGLVKTR